MVQLNLVNTHTSTVNSMISECTTSNVTTTAKDVFNKLPFTNSGVGARGQVCTFVITLALLVNSPLETVT